MFGVEGMAEMSHLNSQSSQLHSSGDVFTCLRESMEVFLNEMSVKETYNSFHNAQ